MLKMCLRSLLCLENTLVYNKEISAKSNPISSSESNDEIRCVYACAYVQESLCESICEYVKVHCIIISPFFWPYDSEFETQMTDKILPFLLREKLLF